jgi:hypothetical protein
MTQTIPCWTGFYCLLSEKRRDVTVVAYPSIIDAKPTDMSTVPTVMEKCFDMSMDAGEEPAIQAFDQQLHSDIMFYICTISAISTCLCVNFLL